MNNIIQFPKFLRKTSPVFQHFPQFDEVHYTGPLNGKIMVFSTQEGSHKGEVLMMSLIRKDEAELWQAFRGLIMDILSSIEPKLVGIFRFQLLSIAMAEDLEKFQWKEFSQGIRDLSREIPVGESRFDHGDAAAFRGLRGGFLHRLFRAEPGAAAGAILAGFADGFCSGAHGRIFPALWRPRINPPVR